MRDNYKDILNAFVDRGFSIHKFSEFNYEHDSSVPYAFRIRKKDYEGKRILLLRHDIDHDVSYAYKMAKLEASMNIFSTYFVLTTDTARAWWKDPVKKIQGIKMLAEMQAMGHEIGFHYDALGDFFRGESSSIKESIELPLNFLRQFGLRINGAAAHGSTAVATGRKAHNSTNWVNYHIWRDRADSHKAYFKKGDRSVLTDGQATLSWQGREVTLPCVSLDDFELTYEAYSVFSDWYYADSRGGKHCMKFSPTKKSHMDGLEIKNINKDMFSTGDVMQALFHPIYW